MITYCHSFGNFIPRQSSWGLFRVSQVTFQAILNTHNILSSYLDFVDDFGVRICEHGYNWKGIRMHFTQRPGSYPQLEEVKYFHGMALRSSFNRPRLRLTRLAICFRRCVTTYRICILPQMAGTKDLLGLFDRWDLISNSVTKPITQRGYFGKSHKIYTNSCTCFSGC